MDDTGRGLADAYEQRLKLVELADARGLHAYHLAEHHGTPLGLAPSPNLIPGLLHPRGARAPALWRGRQAGRTAVPSFAWRLSS